MDAIATLDAGTGSVRCVVFDPSGTPLASAQEPFQYQLVSDPVMPMIRGFDLDTKAFWVALARCARQALERLPPGTQLRGVIATSQREACVFVDAAGETLYAGPNLDARAAMEGFEAQQVIDQARLHAITGHAPPFIFALSRLLWFRKHREFARIAHLLMLNDWITYRLSGAMVAEHSNAGESMLYDVTRREWSAEILTAFDFPRAILPPLVIAGTRVGAVTAAAAVATGIPAGTPVFAGGADTESALLGAGLHRPGETGAVLGTTAPVQQIRERPEIDPGVGLWTSSHVVDGQWVLEANAGDSGDTYLWLMETLFGSVEPGAFAAAEREIAGVGATGRPVYGFLGPLVFQPTAMSPFRPAGLLFPFPILHVDRPNRGELLVGFLENLAFAIRANYEAIVARSGVRAAVFSAGGGLTRSRALVVRLASTLGLPVETATVTETACLGSAMLAAVGAGLHRDIPAAVAAMTRRTRVEPDPALVEVTAARYPKWRELFDQLFALQV